MSESKGILGKWLREHQTHTCPYVYHFGLSAGTGGGLWGNGHGESTVVAHMVRSVDFLPTDLWVYCGIIDATKAEVRLEKSSLLEAINAEFDRNFKHIIIE